MEKIYKNLILLICSFLFLFSGCSDDDGYSLGKFVINLATVNPSENGRDYYLTLDNGTTLWPASSNVYYKPEENQRVWVNYTLLSDSISGFDHYVKINNIQNILTKNVIDMTSANEQEIGNDPIIIESGWIGDNYLNIHFGYNIGREAKHTVNVIRNASTNISSNNDTIFLELRHNSNNDPGRYPTSYYGAFNLRRFQQNTQKTVPIVIKAKDFDGQEKQYFLTYFVGNKK